MLIFIFNGLVSNSEYGLAWIVELLATLQKKKVENDYGKGQLLSQIKTGFEHKHSLLWQPTSFDGWRINDGEISDWLAKGQMDG